MKIIVNATPLLNIATGIGRYLQALYTEIRLRHPQAEIRFFDGRNLSDALPTPPKSKGLWTVAVDLAWRLPFLFPYAARIILYHKQARAFLKLSTGFDLYHEAGFFPFKAAKSVKTVFTIHDLSLITLPAFHPKDRVLFFRKYFESSLPRVDAVITPSSFTARELRRLYPGLAVPVTPIHLGYDRRVFYRRSAEEIAALREKFRLPEKYLLFVGTADPRKNVKAIWRALACLPEPVTLVCAGWSGWDRMEGMAPVTESIKKRMVFTGYVADRDLAALYSGARAFVYPSFYEGFGLPVLEAMACGCPVVCSSRASLPEVAGDAAITCDPEDVPCLAAAIRRVFLSDDLSAEMSANGLAQARKFNWSDAADATIRVFEKVYRDA